MKDKRKIHILFVNPFSSSIGVSGADRSLLSILSRLDKNKYSFSVAFPIRSRYTEETEDSFYREEYEKTGAKIYNMRMCILYRTKNPFAILKNLFFLISNIINLVRIIKKERVKIVHSNNTAILASGIAARLCGVASIYHVREIIGKPKIMRVLYPRLINHLADEIICISKAVAAMFLENSVPHYKVRVIYNGIDLSMYDKTLDSSKLKRQFNLPDNSLLVGIVGRISPRKGHRYFIEAAKKVLEEIPSARFFIVGWIESHAKVYSDLLNNLRRQVNELGLYKYLRFTGVRKNFPDVMASLDVVVLASASEAAPEPFGRVIVEAMAASKAVVATNEGGVPELIEDGRTGLLVPPADSSSLAKAIIRLLKNEQERKQIGEKAKESLKDKFAEEIMVGKIEEVYQDVISLKFPAIAKEVYGIEPKKTILYVNPFSSAIGVSGADVCLIDLIKALDKTKYNAFVVLPTRSQFNKELRKSYYYNDYIMAGAKVVFVRMCLLYRTWNVFSILKNLLILVPNIYGLISLIKKYRVQILHSNNMALIAPGIAAKIAKVPCIYHIREIIRHPKIASIIYPYLITKLADKIICISEAVAEMFRRFKLNENFLYVIYDGIDLREFHPEVDGSKLRKELNLDSETPLVGIVGRISRRKGHIYFIEASRIIKDEIPEAKFIVVGWIDSEFKKYRDLLNMLIKRVEELGLKDDFYFLGNRRDVPEIMKALNVHVMASASYAAPEPFGRVIVESMAIGTPVVATRDGAVPEIINDRNGILVPIQNPQAIAEGVIKLLKNKDLHTTLSQNAIKTVQEKFNVVNSTRQIINIYEEILSKRTY
jgi:glycosyltransferase involved in cell wall biosynthesis